MGKSGGQTARRRRCRREATDLRTSGRRRHTALLGNHSPLTLLAHRRPQRRLCRRPARRILLFLYLELSDLHVLPTHWLPPHIPSSHHPRREARLPRRSRNHAGAIRLPDALLILGRRFRARPTQCSHRRSTRPPRFARLRPEPCRWIWQRRKRNHHNHRLALIRVDDRRLVHSHPRGVRLHAGEKARGARAQFSRQRTGHGGGGRRRGPRAQRLICWKSTLLPNFSREDSQHNDGTNHSTFCSLLFTVSYKLIDSLGCTDGPQRAHILFVVR